jgi:hypothetical protein
MRKEKKDKGLVKNVLDKSSYFVGYLCAKTAKIKDVTNAKGWKDTVSASKDFMDKAGEKTSAFMHDAQEGAAHIKESFMSGFESAKEGLTGHDHAKKAVGSVPVVTKARSGAAAKKWPKSKAESGTKAKSGKKLSPQERQRKMKELSETPADPDIEKEIDKIDDEVAEAN